MWLFGCMFDLIFILFRLLMFSFIGWCMVVWLFIMQVMLLFCLMNGLCLIFSIFLWVLSSMCIDICWFWCRFFGCVLVKCMWVLILLLIIFGDIVLILFGNGWLLLLVSCVGMLIVRLWVKFFGILILILNLDRFIMFSIGVLVVRLVDCIVWIWLIWLLNGVCRVSVLIWCCILVIMVFWWLVSRCLLWVFRLVFWFCRCVLVVVLVRVMLVFFSEFLVLVRLICGIVLLLQLCWQCCRLWLVV